MKQKIMSAISILSLLVATVVLVITIQTTNANKAIISEQQEQIKILSEIEPEPQQTEQVDLSEIYNRLESVEQSMQTVTSGVESMNQAIDSNKTQISYILSMMEENGQVHSNPPSPNPIP